MELHGQKKRLKDYLTRIEEAEKRDHRKLGKKHSLFHIQEESPGMIFGIQMDGQSTRYWKST